MVHWDLIGYIISSKYRKKVIILLKDKPFTPREIADNLDIHLSHTSQILKQLVDKNVIECLNPTVVRGRLYSLTNIGNEIIQKLEL